jgi:hypothetical protein
MELRELDTSISIFWENQNQKLLARDEFINGNIYSDVWYFKHKNGSTNIDFSIFDLPHTSIDNLAILEIDGEEYPLSAKEYAKLFFMAAMPKNGVFGLPACEQMIIHIATYLKAWESPQKKGKPVMLEISDLEGFWTSFLVQSVNRNGFFNRVSAPSHKAYIKPIKLPLIRNRLKSQGISGGIAHDITPLAVNKALDVACQSQLNVTLNEYKLGGNFNFLGLEIGQYYIDYLRRVYQKDYLYTLCCKKTIDKLKLKHDLNHMESRSRSVLLRVIKSAFTQNIFNPSTSLKSIRGTRTKGVVHQSLYDDVRDKAYIEYLNNYDTAMSLNEENIEKLVIKLGLNMRFDAVEIIRILMLQKFYALDGGKTPEQVWRGYLMSLDKTFLDSNNLIKVTVGDIYNKMSVLIGRKKLDKISFLNEMVQFGLKLKGRCKENDFKSFKSELNKTINAMTNLVVAWLGYRQTEFGFPFNAIHIEPNLDILDNSHVPFRFKLKWFVPKTNGVTKINREITSQSYQIAAQLNDIFDAKSTEPCLYKTSSSGDFIKNNITNKSESIISERVKSNWKNFILDYEPFNDAIRLDTLTKDKNDLNISAAKELKSLSQIFDITSARYIHLLKTANEVKQDWERLKWTNFDGTLLQKKFKESIQCYIETGSAKCVSHQVVIDKYLSEKTKKLLMDGRISLDVKTMSDINSEIKGDCKYPSPHAMRHIWAEAVLTRYSGDIGAVIRHQFCHLDSSFFAAYLQEKDTRGLFEGARQRYLNSIVEMLLIDSKKIGKNYLGGFARFVKKAMSRTNTVTNNSIRALRDGINGRVISIQSSHFVTCLPRYGGEQRAKCAKFGSINPQDAKPSFCLNCTYGLITSGNLRGIWTTIEPMVKEALDKKTMGFMIEGHLTTLRSGYKRIKELQEASINKDDVAKILNAIEEAISSIDSKLKQEGL